MNRTATLIIWGAAELLVSVPATADKRIALIDAHRQVEHLNELTRTHTMHPFALIHIGQLQPKDAR